MSINIIILGIKSENDFNNCMNIYEEAFPPGEKRLVDDIKRNIEKTMKRCLL
jgi:hypothetical protein